MIWEVTLPQLGETVTEGTVVHWHHAEGDHVERDEGLYDISTDKVDTEIPAARPGYLRRIVVPAGGSAPIGAAVAVMSDTADEPLDEAAGPVPASAAPAAEPARAATPPAVPTADPFRTTVTVPPDVSVPATVTVPVLDVPAVPSTNGGAPAAPRTGRFLSPVVRRLVADLGLDAEQLTGSGQGGRITRADVLAAAALRDAGATVVRPPVEVPASPARGDVPLPAVGDGDTVEEFSKARAATARAMEASRHATVCTHVTVQVRWAAVERVRTAAGHTYMPYVARALVEALAAHPRLNAHTDGHRLVRRHHVQLGVAVQADGALLVPVVQAAERLRLPALAEELDAVARTARAGRWVPATAPTFTVTNVGRWGTVTALPELVPPQVGILSVDGITHTPVAVPTGSGWAVAVEPVGNLTLGFDHRAVDGAEAAEFLDRVRRELEGRDWGAET